MVKETLDEKALAFMKTILEQLARKKTILPELDAKLSKPSRTQENPHLAGLRITHPVTIHEKFYISLLIGADHHRDIVEDEVIRGGGPTAVASKLGYLLSEPLQTSSVSTSTTVVNLLQTLSSTKKEKIDLQRK
ncbi:hypothetical protein P5673_021074 [Acropora cervicornis]|uniref:Uncharacterized protein n=1 Tax=Acropora cervicornis TaxID=6130 RepID=A0AAD9V0Q0_ACRCE|nr:hypothetical protein P5673_021074 [Acropora cervicornis]